VRQINSGGPQRCFLASGCDRHPEDGRKAGFCFWMPCGGGGGGGDVPVCCVHVEENVSGVVYRLFVKQRQTLSDDIIGRITD